MAENTNPDIRLVVGVDEKLSFNAMNKSVKAVINQLNEQKYKINVDISSDEIQKFKKEVSSLLSAMKNIGTNGNINVGALTKFDGSLKSAHKSVLNIKNAVKGLSGDYSKDLSKLSNSYNNFENAVKNLNSNFARGKVTDAELANLQKLRLETDKLINSIQVRIEAEKKASNANGNSSSSNEIITLEKRASALTRIANLIAQCTNNQKNWTAAASGGTKGEYNKYAFYIKQLEQLEKQLTDGTISLSAFNEKIKTIQSNIAKTNTVIKGAGKNVKSFADRFGTIASKLSAWFSAQKVLELTQRLLREMITSVKDLDAAMTELRKVTDATEQQYEKFLENAVKRAKTLGATLVDTVSSSADMARLGYNLTDAATLADTALVYKNVGDGISDIDEASSSIISTMQAFKVEAKDSLNIVDKFNTAGKYLCRAA